MNYNSSYFNIEDKHDIIYIGTCPETTCNYNYIIEGKRQTSERVKDHNDRDIKSHITRAPENYHQPVSEKDFKIIGNSFQGSKKKKKVDDALLFREIKQTLNEHPRSVGATAVI